MAEQQKRAAQIALLAPQRKFVEADKLLRLIGLLRAFLLA